MDKRKKIKIGSLMLIPFVFTGCEKRMDDSTEVVDDFLMSDSNDMSENKEDLKNDSSVSLEEETKEETKEDVKEESNLDESTKNPSTDKNTVSSKNEVQKNDKNTSESSKKEDNKNSLSETVSNNTSSSSDNKVDDIVLVDNPVFTKSEIPEHIKQKMLGNSMAEDSTVSFDELSYLKISHVDYNGKTQVGEMVVSSKLANEVLDIFRDIYNAKFPIEKIKLIDDYGASDHASMVDNNSSAFCYRTIAGTSKVSNHGLGVAIDINPFYNPHVLKSKGTVNPPEASKYADRTLNAKGMIKKNDAVYKAFTSRGWKWGGNWNNPDYQHFEKSI